MTQLNTEQLKQLQSDVNKLNRRYNRLFGKLFKMLPSDYAKNPLIHVTVNNDNHKDQTEIIYSIFPDLFHIETKITTDDKHFEESTSQQRRETLFVLPTGSIINTVLQACQDEFKDYFDKPNADIHELIGKVTGPQALALFTTRTLIDNSHLDIQEIIAVTTGNCPILDKRFDTILQSPDDFNQDFLQYFYTMTTLHHFMDIDTSISPQLQGQYDDYLDQLEMALFLDKTINDNDTKLMFEALITLIFQENTINLTKTTDKWERINQRLVNIFDTQEIDKIDPDTLPTSETLDYFNNLLILCQPDAIKDLTQNIMPQVKQEYNQNHDQN